MTFVNTSPLDLRTLVGDQDHIAENLRAYIQGFSGPVREIFERFEFHGHIDRLAKAKLLYFRFGSKTEQLVCPAADDDDLAEPWA